MIKPMQKYPFHCNSIGISDYQGFTIIELLNEYFVKINECVEISNESKELLEWIKLIGLPQEVEKLFVQWIEDGTWEQIINEKIFGDMLEYVNSELTRIEDLLKKIDVTEIIEARTNGITGSVSSKLKDRLDSDYNYSKSLDAKITSNVNNISSNLGKINTINSAIDNAKRNSVTGQNYNTLADRINGDSGDIKKLKDSKFDKSGGVISGETVFTDRIKLRGGLGGDTLIRKNTTPDRSEVQIYSEGDGWESGSNGSGIHLYGNSDTQHPGSIAFMTGENNEGYFHFMMDKVGRTCVGNTMIDFVDEGRNYGQLTIKNPQDRPGLYIIEAGETEGEIAVAQGEIMRLGGYDPTNGFETWLRLSNNVIRFKNNDVMVRNTNLQRGRAEVYPVANEPTITQINFPVPFADLPTVVVTPYTGVVGTTVQGCGVTNVTTTGFELSLFRTNTTKTLVNWIAMY